MISIVLKDSSNDDIIMAVVIHQNIAKRADKARLTAGPAIAILNSLLKSLGSSSISDTPPKINRTICFTLIPYLLATIECDNS